jgi:hypothetical protein
MPNEFNIKNGFITSGNSFVYAGLNVTSGLTATTISATTYFNLPSSSGGTFTGGTVSGGTNFTGGVTANTISQVNYIDFDTTPNVPSPTGGTLYFDSTENALSYKPITPNNDVTVNLGQESLIRIYNDLGFQINNGQALHITGATSGSPTVSLAIGVGGDSVQFQISGIATQDIPNSSFGFMTVFGVVRDLNLTGFTVGQQIYLSQTVPGGLSSYSGLSFTGRTCEVGHVLDNSASGKIQVAILNEIEGTIITTQENNILAANNSSTGIFEFSGLSISTPSGTTFNVGPVQGWIIDNVTSPTNPTIQLIIYTGSTGNTALYVSSATETYILLTSGLTITQQTTFPTPQQRRQNLYLGKFGHANRQYLINAFNEPDSSLSPVSQLRDMFDPIRLINGGIYPSANGNSLTFNTSAGVLYGLGLGYITNKLNPNSLSVSGTSPCTFQYRTQTGGTASNTTLITPGVYDNNGVVTSVGGGSNSSTNQRIYLVQNGQFRLQYGQQVYGSLAAAIEASQNETFTTFSNFRDNAILIGILSVNKNATNLSDTTQAIFLLTSKFGETVGAAGGISTTNLQQAYNNSSTPEIVTNSTEGALSIKNGTGNVDNTTNLLEGVNSGGTTTSFIRADGAFSGTSIYGTNLTATTISATTATIRKITGGSGNTNSGTYSFIGGGQSNSATGNCSVVGGGRQNTLSGSYSFVGGGQFNTASSTGSTIAGGLCNIAGGAYSFIGGGTGNTMTASTSCFSSISSGVRNTIICRNSFIGSGSGNTIGGDCGFIGTGLGNCLSVVGYTSIINGCNNTVSGTYGIIGNGSKNLITAIHSFIGNGSGNTVCAGTYSFIGSGCQNNVTGSNSSIVGGGINTTNSGYYSIGHNFLGGGRCNNINSDYSTISGGYKNTNTEACGSFIGGGISNSISGTYGNNQSSSIVGGYLNSMINTQYSVIAGGASNYICSNSTVSLNNSIVGGGSNAIFGNIYGLGINLNTIAGGSDNYVVNQCNSSILGGGKNIITGITFSDSHSTISGGYCNSIRCSNSFIGGGRRNTITGCFSGILGGSGNTVSGAYSFAAGCGLNATAPRTFYTNNIITEGFSATTISATTYQNIPSFTGGTVSGATSFISGLTANTISATTISSRGGNVVTKISSGIDSSGNTIAGAYQLVQSVLIPANTITAGDVVLFKVRYRKIGTNAAANYRIVVNTTLNLTGAQIVAQYNGGATILYSELSRTAAVKGAETEVFPPAVTNTPSDVNISTIAVTKLTIDWTVNQFIMYSILNSSASDTTFVSYYSISEI